ncbi:MAG: hypothetical protein AAF950_01955 [Pseudomonadota bacterium]
MKLRKLMLAGGAVAALTGVPAQAAVVDNPQFRVLGLVIVWGADGFSNGTPAGGSPVVSDFVIDTATGAGDTDLIDGDVHTVVTGFLTPTADAVASNGTPFNVTNAVTNGGLTGGSDGILDAADADTFAAFQIDQTTDVELDNVMNSSFFVASNTTFAINATATETTPTGDAFDLDDIAWEMSVQPSGSVDNGGTAFAFGSAAQDPVNTLATVPTDLSGLTGGAVYQSTLRTAAGVGSIAEQSVRFDVTYTLGGADGYDLSQGTGQIEADVVYTVFVP